VPKESRLALRTHSTQCCKGTQRRAVQEGRHAPHAAWKGDAKQFMAALGSG